MRTIKFVSLNLQNFKSHRDLTVKFGDLTKITGDNTKGKSTIPEAISWLLYGTTVFNSKLDPTPITYEAEETLVSLLLEVDDNQFLLGRGLKKGKTQYYINEAPKKAGDFNEILEQLFDKELFFSLFNPQYFFTLHWEKQRAMVLQYVTAPANKEVLKTMLDEQEKCLEPLLKKHSLEDLEGIHKENKKRMDNIHTGAQRVTKKLKEQLGETQSHIALDSLKAEISQLAKAIREIEKVTDQAGDTNRKINTLQSKINTLVSERDQIKEEHKSLLNEQIQGNCRVCLQPLQDESLKAAEREKQSRLDRLEATFKLAIKNRKELQSQLDELEYIDVSEQLAKVRELEAQKAPLEEELRKHREYEKKQGEVLQAEAEEKEALESLNNSIFILDTIKAFKAKEAELQTEKVQALFETLSIRLFDTQKNGEVKNTFIIEMDGKPHNMLSLSEGIRAGLELREVLSQQSEVIAPVFVDNAESITKFKQPSGQLILSRVVAGEDLKIVHD
ncbi:ATPase [Bacillus sp. AG4(2022)]|uniref:ATPase n=1 Tax=Bacillus sp. AG4(2022) TaxID=2962594 RepID=UPI002881E5EE|nr:ATPase [Bacillus sp. AG4(2022)]MDT0163851.1 AAA family ATPase [Bacillus sp. AG4(2022)]